MGRCPLALLCLLTAAGLGAESSRQSSLTLVVRPEALLVRLGSDGVMLKIRLAEGAQARLWGAESCDASAGGSAGIGISRSDTYTLPLSAFQAAESKYACLSSSDGSIQRSVVLRDR